MRTNNHEAQRDRLLDALRKGPVTTDQAKEALEIPQPGPRIWELRHWRGVRIATLIAHQDGVGRKKRTALYVLMADQPKQEVAHAECFG